MTTHIHTPCRTAGIAAALLFIIASCGRAQSVDSLIRAAYRNNPQLLSLSHQADAAAYRASAVGAMPPPTLGIEFSQVPSTSADLVNDAVSNNISLSQMFMLGGKLSVMSRMEEQKGSLLEHTRASVLAKLRAAVRSNYVQLWLLDRQLEIQRRTIRLLEELGVSLQSRVETNRSSGADLLTVKAEAASERARLSTLSAKRTAIQNVLLSLTTPLPAVRSSEMRMDMGAPQPRPDSEARATSAFAYTTRVTIIPDSILPALPAPLPVDELTGMLLESNPSLLSMDHMKQMNDLEIEAAHKELIPDLMVQAMVMRMPNGMILTGGPRSAPMIRDAVDGMTAKTTDWMYSIMASITLPFAPWSSERSSAKADEMRSMNLSVDAEKNAMQREMLASLASSVTTLEAQDSLVRQYHDTILPLTQAAAAAQTAAYRTGQAALPAVIDAYRMELMKTDEYLMAVMDRQMTFIDLEMMVGVPLQ